MRTGSWRPRWRRWGATPWRSPLWPLEERRPEALRLAQASLGLLERAEGLEARELLDEAQRWMRERPPETGD